MAWLEHLYLTGPEAAVAAEFGEGRGLRKAQYYCHIIRNIMAYELHIERLPLNADYEPTPIPIGEWKAAIATMKDVRLSPAEEISITNPKTGEVISMGAREGDAEVYFPDEKEWVPAIRWFGGAAHFNARFEPGDKSHPVWAAATALATRLGATIRGDDGETYDIETGEIIDG